MEEAFNLVCKIHRLLPPGGILVFLTGKQEITVLKNRLEEELNTNKEKEKKQEDNKEICENVKPKLVENNNTEINDQDNDVNTFAEIMNDDLDMDLPKEYTENSEINEIKQQITDSKPKNNYKKAVILPFYSNLSPEVQAKVFLTYPDDTRLIIISTNVAETSITIPSIRYVIDSGREKKRVY